MQGLRVLFVVRPDAQTRPGGDAVQAAQTAVHMRALGHTVDVAYSAHPDARGYDVAHVFGVFDPPLARTQIHACASAGTRIALSPIWWDLTEFYARSRAVEKALTLRAGAVDRRLERIRAASPHQLLPRRERERAGARKVLQRELMHRAAVLLPNSLTEAYHYMRDLDLQHPRVHVVPNAIDADLLQDAPQSPSRTGVLCAGRVESRKNQAMLAYAMREDDVEITLAGECYDAYYRDLCTRWNKRLRFTGVLDRPAVFDRMRSAAVHALPAWLETPGIAALEAAALGCAAVNGNRASEYEYFRENARYCDPGDPQSIRTAVLAALEPAHNDASAMRARLRAFTWQQAAQATLDGYALVL